MSYERPSEIKHPLREAWLTEASELLWPYVTEGGGTRPKTVRVSCGWPSSGGLRSGSGASRTIGQCWHDTASADGAREVFISPVLDDEIEVLATLLHELIHAALPGGVGHGPEFRKVMVECGLAGKPTATHAGPEVMSTLRTMAHELGRYPHAKLDGTRGRKKQATRMVKVVCSDGECGCTLRMTRKWIDDGKVPTCGCGEPMAPEGYEVGSGLLAA